MDTLVAAERIPHLGEEPQDVTTVLLLNHPVLVGKETVYVEKDTSLCQRQVLWGSIR